MIYYRINYPIYSENNLNNTGDEYLFKRFDFNEI